MSFLVLLILLSHPDKTLSKKPLCIEKSWTIDFAHLTPLFKKIIILHQSFSLGLFLGFQLPLGPAPVIGNTASLSPLLTSQLLLAELCFFPPLLTQEGAAAFYPNPPAFKSSAVIWEEAKCGWEPWGLCQFLLACPPPQAASYWAGALFTLPFFLAAQTGG